MPKRGCARRGRSEQCGRGRSRVDRCSSQNDEQSPRTPPARQASEVEDNASSDNDWQQYRLHESAEPEDENAATTENENPPPTTRREANRGSEFAESEEENDANTDNGNPPTCRRRGVNRGTDVRPDSQRVHITVKHRRFLEPPVSRDITATMKQFLNGPHSTYGDLSSPLKKAFWKKFKQKFKWSPKKTAEVRDTFKKTSEDSLKGMFERARRHARKASKSGNPNAWKEHGPPWLSKPYWTELCEKKWSDPDYQKKCETARKNRMTKKGGTISKHTGGSIPFVAHEKKLEEKLKRKVRRGELFAHTHKRNQGTGDYVDDKSKDVIEKYTSALEEKHGPNTSQQPLFDANAWIKATNGSSKGRVYGFSPAERASVILGTSQNSESSDDSPNDNNVSERIVTLEAELEEIKRTSQEEIEKIKAQMVVHMKRQAIRSRRKMKQMIRNMLRELNIPNSEFASGSGTK